MILVLLETWWTAYSEFVHEYYYGYYYGGQMGEYRPIRAGVHPTDQSGDRGAGARHGRGGGRLARLGYLD
jgi:hypothetical protein